MISSKLVTMMMTKHDDDASLIRLSPPQQRPPNNRQSNAVHRALASQTVKAINACRDWTATRSFCWLQHRWPTCTGCCECDIRTTHNFRVLRLLLFDFRTSKKSTLSCIVMYKIHFMASICFDLHSAVYIGLQCITL